MVEVDLHLHTSFSDGNLSPGELVRLCGERGLKVIAITDHDSTEGVSEALRAAENLGQMAIIPGIELSADVPRAEVHLLGYFVDRMDPSLQRTLRELRDGRDDRARAMVRKLRSLGVDITWERVEEISGGGAIGRPHIAQALVEGGYVNYPKDAFDRYLGRNGPAYIERAKLTPADAIEIVLHNGGVPVLAHPTYVIPEPHDDFNAIRRTASDLKDAGLVGMEVHYKDYSRQQVESLATIARDLDLIPCGGSDYHASGNPGEPEPGAAGPPMETVTRLESARRRIPGAR